MKVPTVQAVIGAGYGDEGKGLMVDALAARALSKGRRVTVVRANGGAQAGHTVVAPDGRRHVFHHVGAGALAGATTHLSRFFVAHPMLWEAERAQLEALGACLTVTVDPACPLTTPYEVMINQAVEAHRGRARHGSCGLGFGETVEREEKGPSITAAMLDDETLLRARLDEVRRVWVPARLAELGLDPAALDVWRLDDRILKRFLADVRAMAAVVSRCPWAEVRADAFVFEGAQGLGLDQARGAFPFVTRSFTGLRNPLALCEERRWPSLDAVYVTRCYRTRHGAGPLPDEHGGSLGPRVVDTTNAPNPHQGVLRFAPLDPSALAVAIAADRSDAAGSSTTVRSTLAMTCLDQAEDGLPWREGSVLRSGRPSDLVEAAQSATGLACAWRGYGPTRATVQGPG